MLEAVETVPAHAKEIKSSLNKAMKKHKKTLDEIAQSSNHTAPFNFEDIHAAIEKRYPKNTSTMQKHLLTVASAIWSMQSNQQQHIEIDRVVKKIMENRPALNYWKRIEKMQRH